MDFGMKASTVRPLFARLRAALVPLVKAIADRPRLDTSCLGQPVPEAEQERFAVEVIRRFGYDLERGRIDRTHHPFMTKFSLGDVRITTKYRQDDVSFALFSTLHEAGHALYEQGIAAEYEGTPLANGTSAGVHESQSRMWENIVGRSQPFCRHFYPRLQETMPGFRNVSLDAFYRAINCVEPSLIRIEADEVTYNLHVLLRFELELAILRGQLETKDLPAAWNSRMKDYLGVEPKDDVEGVMQDIHWAFGEFGYFPTYAIGNLYSAMLLETLQKEVPALWDAVGRGELKVVLDWLRAKIHRQGFLDPAEELIEKVTGKKLTEAPFIDYLWTKYRPLYGLQG
jgi:carboxypeptidase Taq